MWLTRERASVQIPTVWFQSEVLNSLISVALRKEALGIKWVRALGSGSPTHPTSSGDGPALQFRTNQSCLVTRLSQVLPRAHLAQELKMAK